MSSRDEVPVPPAALFPDRATRERVDDRLTRALAQAGERVLRGPVMPDIDMMALRRELSAFDFKQPQPLEELIDWAIGSLEHGAVHMTHPRYFGLFNPAPNFPSQCADRISGAFNPQLASSGSSPAPVAIEQHVIRAMAARAGLPADSAGHFTTAGSEANYTALVCALTRADGRFASDGVRAFGGPVAFYTSRECQPAWHKIAHQAGVGRSALRLIATDGTGRMDARALAEAVREDRRRGTLPVLISTTAGTTGAGMVDPLGPCATIARENDVWYHVDAAWGGAALCSDRLRGELAGIELADSVTLDAHKWLATTMGCGMFITRHPATLSEAFRVGAEFMPSSATSIDPYLNTVQWSRRFLGLRLFLSLGAAGWQGYAAHVERAVDVIDCAKVRLAARGWSIANDSRLAVLCVLPPAGFPPVREIVRKVLASGRAWVAVAKLEGREVVRICATHGEITIADVEELVSALEAAR
ncbi:MAG TPA: pyridoxal-dependent decarboxylase [Steroidobacteraceae bacterium]|jgi:glutamate/tyrosine decarboxylase-like PLP-dependent enzyme|nr:pyridoxal-dependent decarboxylase [Steroidobacteraceae bacterium]